jgi:hypothetical protein
MQHEQWDGGLPRRTLVDEVHAQAIDLSPEVLHGIHSLLLRRPVEAVAPILYEALHVY